MPTPPTTRPNTDGAPAGFVRRNALALALTGAAFLLLALVYWTDREQGLYKTPSNRYRFHAIPVYLAHRYHEAPRDYTSYTYVAHRFQDGSRDLEVLIDEATRAERPAERKTYFWTADDRGLSDYVAGAFGLWGPRTKSLTKFYFLLLGAAVLLFAAGYRRAPGALAVPIGVLTGILALAHTFQGRADIPMGDTVWGEEIALYESRLFDLLALVSWFHLAVLAVLPRPPRAAWVTAVPQAALIVFLYHGRSSLGWEYLALGALLAARTAWWAWARPGGWRTLAPAGFVGVLVAGSLVGLGAYKKATYHPAYFAGQGNRTFWHNALMGYHYHPALRQSLPMPAVSDHAVAALVIDRMRGWGDPRLDATWEVGNMMNSLGGHCEFDWATYESVAREVYLGVWRDRPAEALACYAYYKPKDVLGQALKTASLLARRVRAGEAPNLVAGLVTGLLAAVILVVTGRRAGPERDALRTGFRTTLWLLPFSLIPGIAFYAAVTTLSCWYAGLVTAVGLGAVRAGGWLAGRWRTGQPDEVTTPAVATAPARLAA